MLRNGVTDSLLPAYFQPTSVVTSRKKPYDYYQVLSKIPGRMPSARFLKVNVP